MVPTEAQSSFAIWPAREQDAVAARRRLRRRVTCVCRSLPFLREYSISVKGRKGPALFVRGCVRELEGIAFDRPTANFWPKKRVSARSFCVEL